jgi:hypothetical protein
MASIFCPSCGSKSEYKFATPNFCFKCGSSYSQTSNSIKATNVSTTIQSKNLDPDERDDWDDEDEDSEGDFGDFSNSTRVPRISRIQVETDSSTDVKIIKFGDLLNENSASSFKRPKNLDFGNM